MYTPKIFQIPTIALITIGFLSNLSATEQDTRTRDDCLSKVPLLQLEGASISGEQGASYEDVSADEYTSFEALLSAVLSEEELTYEGPINGFIGEKKYHEERKLYYYRRIDPSWTNVPKPEIGQKYSFRYDEETDSYYSYPRIVIQTTTSLDDNQNNNEDQQFYTGSSSFEDPSDESLSPRTLIDLWKGSGNPYRLDFADNRYDERRNQFYLIDPDHFAQSPQLSDAEIIKNIMSHGYTHKQAYAFFAAQAILDEEVARIKNCPK